MIAYLILASYKFFRHQLDLFAQMCQEQQYLAIDPPPERHLLNLSAELPPDLVLKLFLRFHLIEIEVHIGKVRS